MVLGDYYRSFTVDPGEVERLGETAVSGGMCDRVYTHTYTNTHTHLSKYACTVQTQPPPPTQTHVLTDLLLDQPVTHRALLALMRVSVVEVVELTLVALVTHKALATGTGAVAMALHGSRAHRVAVTGCEQGGEREDREVGWTCESKGM